MENKIKIKLKFLPLLVFVSLIVSLIVIVELLFKQGSFGITEICTVFMAFVPLPLICLLLVRFLYYKVENNRLVSVTFGISTKVSEVPLSQIKVYKSGPSIFFDFPKKSKVFSCYLYDVDKTFLVTG